MRPERIRTLVFPSILICFALLYLISCAPKARVAVSQLDTPGHHTFTGLKLLDLEKYPDAQREFKMAIQLNNGYSKAYTGLALVDIFTGRLDAASDNLQQGYKYASTNDEKLFANVSRIRYYAISKSDPKWLEMAKNQFDEAVKIDPKYSPAYYYMGMAYKDGLDFDSAGRMFNAVILLKTNHIADAETQLKFLQKVAQAMPSTEAGKKIALTERLSRADAAALFVEELKIKELYNKLAPKQPDTALKEQKVLTDVKDAEKPVPEPKETAKAPVDASQTAVLPPPPVKPMANDIAEQPFRKDIEGVLETGVRGLENDPKGNFNPGEVISRGEFAIMLEDILIKLTGEKELAARYVNSKSLFPDVPADMPYFNAIISVTSKEIMEAKNTKTGEFAPLKPLSGVEALLTIKKIKDKLKLN